MENCKFCSILNNEIPSRRVYEDQDVLALLPKNMSVYGHTLIIPKGHYESLYDIPDELLAKVSIVAKKLAIQYQKTIGATWSNLMNAAGKDGQQSVPHFHFHLLPRFKDDGLDTRPVLTPVEADKDLLLKRLRWEA